MSLRLEKCGHADAARMHGLGKTRDASWTFGPIEASLVQQGLEEPMDFL
jgi:hypothetical protein